MGKYTAWDDPLADRIVEDHMRRIAEAIRTRLEPQAISLRGSFGRGEGSVALENGRARFLSDYDINVVTNSSRHRALLDRLSRELTRELEVETNLFWNPRTTCRHTGETWPGTMPATHRRRFTDGKHPRRGLPGRPRKSPSTVRS